MKSVPHPSQTCLCNDDQQKSRSDTKKEGVWLDTFTFGQLYVAASWVGDPQLQYIAVNKSISRNTMNVVYKEIP